MRKRIGAALAGGLAGLACMTACADEMFTGKTINVYIGSGPGGAASA